MGGVTRDVSHCTKGLWRRLHLPLRRARVAQAPQLKEAASARAIVGDSKWSRARMGRQICREVCVGGECIAGHRSFASNMSWRGLLTHIKSRNLCEFPASRPQMQQVDGLIGKGRTWGICSASCSSCR